MYRFQYDEDTKSEVFSSPTQYFKQISDSAKFDYLIWGIKDRNLDSPNFFLDNPIEIRDEQKLFKRKKNFVGLSKDKKSIKYKKTGKRYFGVPTMFFSPRIILTPRSLDYSFKFKVSFEGRSYLSNDSLFYMTWTNTDVSNRNRFNNGGDKSLMIDFVLNKKTDESTKEKERNSNRFIKKSRSFQHIVHDTTALGLETSQFDSYTVGIKKDTTFVVVIETNRSNYQSFSKSLEIQVKGETVFREPYFSTTYVQEDEKSVVCVFGLVKPGIKITFEGLDVKL